MKLFSIQKFSIKTPGFSFVSIVAFVFILLFYSSISNGQTKQSLCDAENENGYTRSHLLCSEYKDINPFTGKPGKLNQWGRGTIYLNTGDSIVQRFLVYNTIGSNLLWIKQGKVSYMLVDKSVVDSFSVISDKNKKKISYEFFSDIDRYYTDGHGALLEILVKDTVSLYLLSVVEKIPMSENLKHHTYYFVKQQGKELQRVFFNTNSLCSIFEQPAAFKKYLIKKNLRITNKKRLIAAVREYNVFIKIN